MNTTKTKTINIIEKIILAASALGLAVMIGTVVFASMYVVPISDDFWYARTGIGVKGLINRLVVAAQFSREIYMGQQGTYFTSFFGSFFNPIISGGFPMMRAVMMVNAIFAFASLLTFIYVAVSRLGVKPIAGRMFLLAVATFVMTGLDPFQEIFYWYVGASVYGYPMSLGILTLTMLLLATGKDVTDKKRNLFYVISAIAGFCAVGASLAITGTVCWMVLAIVLFYMIKDGKVSRGNISVFMVCFIGALINAVAPGNFVRHGVESGASFGLFDAIRETALYYYAGLRWLFINKNYGFVFLVLVIAGFVLFGAGKAEAVLKEKRLRGAYALLTLMLLVTPLVTSFPVIMGYSVGWMPNRCFYVFLIGMNLGLGNLALALGSLISYMVKDKAEKPALILLGAATLIIFAITPYNIREYIFLKVDKQLYTGEIQDNYAKTKEMIEGFADKQGMDVEVDVPTYPEEVRNYYCFFLSDDPGSSINQDIAKAYGLNTIVNRREEQ